MGICLDTEQNNGSQAFEEGQDSWFQNSRRNSRFVASANGGHLRNGISVQFETPKVPVIFVLGGPGSGKVTHCDNLMQEKKGIIHINMTDLLQQYALGNDMQDFSLLSSKTVTEVLMLEMKMAPTAKTYLISGYPRSMRDVVEYSEKIQVVNGAILISWRQKVLERQIDYGAKLGQVVLSLARMELNNFYKNVMPVADYFDQSNMLRAVNGERHPEDVYKDFRTAVLKILGMQDNPPALENGPPPTVPVDVTNELSSMPSQSSTIPERQISERMVEVQRPQTQVISVSSKFNPPSYQSPVKQGWPPVLWIIGGPGSNKAVLCSQVANDTGWIHISLGRLLRTAAEPVDNRRDSDSKKIAECISAGEMVPLDIVMKIIESHIAANISAPGILLDGFPRDMLQVSEFEAKFNQKPTIILLDCSKLQLGRGRLDDSVTAFRRRLEIFRQMSLPMLKAMDNIGRLTIVDGDTDSDPVRQDFKNVVLQHIDVIRQNENSGFGSSNNLVNGGGILNARIKNGHLPNGHRPRENSQDSESLATVSQQVTQNGIVAKQTNTVANGFTNGHAQPVRNGFAVKSTNYANLDAQRRDNIRQMYNSEINHMDGHI